MSFNEFLFQPKLESANVIWSNFPSPNVKIRLADLQVFHAYKQTE
jgi:hypothetical protein